MGHGTGACGGREDEGSGEGAEGPYGPGPVQDPFGHDGRCSAAALPLLILGSVWLDL